MALASAAPALVRYGGVAQTLHWLIAGLIVVQFVLANLAEAAQDAGSLLGALTWFARHKSVGMTILMLACMRLAWRLAHPAPPLPAAMPAWERVAARISHVLLYALLFAMPISGWLMSSSANFPVSWFGLFTWPDLVAADAGRKELFETVHEGQSKGLFALAVLHVAAALKHHIHDRDDVFVRMLPFGRQRGGRGAH